MVTENVGTEESTTILLGDCLERMKEIPDGSVDMVLCDLPYGVVNRDNPHAVNDIVIPFAPLWSQYKRVCKKNAAIVLFDQGMFSAKLMLSQPSLWRYNLVWDKVRSTGLLNANRMPLRGHEDILVFYRSLPEYHPQMEDLNGREPNHDQGHGVHNEKNGVYGNFQRINPSYEDRKHPRSVIRVNAVHCNEDQCHPNQKPVKLLEWLIRSYTGPGDTVLDNAMGSGSTGVACVNTGRRFIGIEINPVYYAAAALRIEKATTNEPISSTIPKKRKSANNDQISFWGVNDAG